MSHDPPYPIVSGVVDGAIAAAGAYAGATVAIGITNKDPLSEIFISAIFLIAISVVIILSVLQKIFLEE